MVDQEDRPANNRRSRMEDEVLEILNRTDRPVSISDHVRRKAQRQRRARVAGVGASLQSVIATAGPGTMLLGCLALAVLAYLIRDVSALLASILVVASVVLLLMPYLGRRRRPDPLGPKRWRGRDIDLAAPPPPWLGAIRDRFRRPPQP